MSEVQVSKEVVLQALADGRAQRIAQLEENGAILTALLVQKDERIAELEALVGAVADGGVKADTP